MRWLRSRRQYFRWSRRPCIAQPFTRPSFPWAVWKHCLDCSLYDPELLFSPPAAVLCCRQTLISEVLLKAGEVLYVPTLWFHYISNIGINAQCNRRVEQLCIDNTPCRVGSRCDASRLKTRQVPVGTPQRSCSAPTTMFFVLFLT